MASTKVSNAGWSKSLPISVASGEKHPWRLFGQRIQCADQRRPPFLRHAPMQRKQVHDLLFERNIQRLHMLSSLCQHQDFSALAVSLHDGINNSGRALCIIGKSPEYLLDARAFRHDDGTG